MRLSLLANLLAGNLPASVYSAEIGDELAEHAGGIEKLGGVAPVRVTEDTDVLLDRARLGVLCRLFASGQLTARELAYSADVLQLSGSVELAAQEIASDLAECTDPEINGPLTIARALEIAHTGVAT